MPNLSSAVRLVALTSCLVLVASAAFGQSRNRDDYVIVGNETVHISNNATVHGNVGANRPGKGKLKVGLGSEISDGNHVVGARVNLGGTAEVYDVYANQLSFKSGATQINGTLTVPMTPPLLHTEPLLIPDPFDPANYPSSFPVNCGIQGQNVLPGSQITLQPGAYDRVRVFPGAKVVLLAGTYNLCRFDADGIIEASGPVTINVRDRFSVGRNGEFGPAAGLSGNDIQINLEGRRKVRIGDYSTAEFRLFAPAAVIKIGRQVQFRGQLLGRKLGCSSDFTASLAADPVQPPTCGDGAVDPGETCDPPGTPQLPNGNLCTNACVYCGDGAVQNGEECDDANDNDDDACKNDCQLNDEICGDGDLDPGETCDPPGTSQAPNGNLCTAGCTYCGDGVVQNGEECDDANTNDGDDCANDCTANPGPSCGDGNVDPGETCDPPGTLQPPNNNPCKGTCTYCGDGITQDGEECDDGNSNDDDYCTNTCWNNDPNVCGDGDLDPGETCDPPGVEMGPNWNLCTNTCTFCGDGIKQANEECDDGNSNNNDDCTNTCWFNNPTVCGDGNVDPGETCDPPGVPLSPFGNLCRDTCNFCGDGVVNGDEECEPDTDDDDNSSACDGSSSNSSSCDGTDDGVNSQDSSSEEDSSSDDNSSACDGSSGGSSSCGGPPDGHKSNDSSSASDSSSETDGNDGTLVMCQPDCTFPDQPDDDSSSCDSNSESSSSCGGSDSDSAGSSGEKGSSDDSGSDNDGSDDSGPDGSSDWNGSDESSSNDR